MKIDDIFEAMTDIDDKFIEAARPIEQDSILIAVPASSTKKALWKTLVPAAAFVAVVAAAGVFGVKYLHGIESANPAASITSESIAQGYPDEAKYIVDSDIKTLTWAYPSGFPSDSPSWIDAHVDYANSYEELAEQSDLIVSGTFIDDIHQTQDVNDTVVADGEVDSYNTLEIDRVIKGDVNAGDFLIIHQSSTINRKNLRDDNHLIFCLDQLSPMFKGDKWVYFLKQEENGTFSPVNGPQGRYPLSNSTNRLISSDGENPNVDEYFTYKNAAPARELIYVEVVFKLEHLPEAQAPELEGIFIPEASFTTFTMEGFPDVEFNVSRLGVTANDADIFAMVEDETLENLYLADLNNDGRRELCATIVGEKKRVEVCDYRNDEYYALSGKDDYFLSTENGVLMLYHTVWESIDLVSTGVEELTLDLLMPVDTSTSLWEVPLSHDQTFTLPDFEGFEFEVESSLEHPHFRFKWGEQSKVSMNVPTEVFFCDLDGDGKREIIMNTTYIGDGPVIVYGFLDNGEFGKAEYYEDGGCRIVESGGKLNYKTKDGESEFKFTRSDLLPIFMQGYSDQLLGWNHTMDFGGVVPVTKHYNIRIEDRTLKVTSGGELMFDSGHKLGELYTIPDTENNSLVFVFTNENDGTVGALKISEKSNKLHRFNENITLKPTADELLVVHEDGTEEPFAFPDDDIVTTIVTTAM